MPNSLFLFVICFGLWIFSGEATKHGHHKRVKGGQRIINGTRVSQLRFPFVVSIQANNISSGEWIHGCGGSIVNSVTILTACHCVASKILGNKISYGNHEIMRVVAGSGSLANLAPSTQTSRVKQLIASPECSNFPQFDDGWYGHDVGLIIIKKPFVFTPQVQPMRVFSTTLFESDRMLKKMVHRGDTCYVVGWGTTEEFEPKNSEYLLISRVNLIPPTECRNMLCELSQAHCYSHFDAIGQVCGVSKASSDCQGDSGGPLVCNGLVYGTVSYGERCLPGWPSVFQSIRPILKLMNSLKPEDELNPEESQRQFAHRGPPRRRALVNQFNARKHQHPALSAQKRHRHDNHGSCNKY